MSSLSSFSEHEEEKKEKTSKTLENIFKKYNHEEQYEYLNLEKDLIRKFHVSFFFLRTEILKGICTKRFF